ncbi:MAG: hypothetical protein LC785_14170 [Acidobacteria bacterium]|nr:hypothetical protein [Acidobacteriota bacterium]MCA1643059.1 hypothetical protein [Acidobacteriota bacterium]
MPRNTFEDAPAMVKLPLAVASFVILAACALAAKTWLAAPVAAQSAETAETAAAPSAAATPAVVARLESEHITIRPTGFEPTEITRPAGRVLLVVNDRSGLDSLDLRLDAGALPRLFEVRVPRDTKGRREWRQLVLLAPGRYVLTEAGHPEWVCRITITAN